MGKIKVSCCEGNELYQGHCFKWRCPIYQKVKERMDRSWPYVGTGFGNLYGNLSHEDFLSGVRKHFSVSYLERRDEKGEEE